MNITSVEVCATVDLILRDIDLVSEAPIMKKNSHSTYLWKMSQPNELSYDHQISPTARSLLANHRDSCCMVPSFMQDRINGQGIMLPYDSHL